MRAAGKDAVLPPIGERLLSLLNAFLEFIGNLGLFALRAARRAFSPPFEWRMIWQQIGEIGWRSLPLVLSSGFAVGLVLTFHTRSTLIHFGAESYIPTVQSLSFFSDIGPLVVGLLIAGRVGAGIGAELAGMRVNEEIDAIEAISIDSFKLLVVPRILACILALPLLTVFADVSGLAGGFLAERLSSHISLHLYLNRAFSEVEWGTFIPPTLKTAVFGFIIALVSSWYGYTAKGGSVGVGRAATSSVVTSSLLIIIADVILVKAIFFLFPGSAV
jgi:phospholipid/cholesterol/gamma-HCH transport system permease protein